MGVDEMALAVIHVSHSKKNPSYLALLPLGVGAVILTSEGAMTAYFVASEFPVDLRLP
jgi:hypothetical protein